MNLIKAKFTFSEYEDFPTFEGAYDPNNRYWNGWANPYFNQATRDAFIEYEKSLLKDMSKEYQKENEEFLAELESIQAETINGEELYYFGGFLCWDEVEEVKTFPKNSWTCFDRTEVDLAGIRYTTTPTYWNKIINDDMPRLKEILGDRLYEWALDGGHTVEIPQDEIFCKEVI